MSQSLTFMWLCIVTNFLMRVINQLDALISQIYFGRTLYMFRTFPLSIIRSFSLYTQQWYMSYRFADSSRAGSCSQAINKPVWHTPLLCVQWKTPDDGKRNCPKHVEGLYPFSVHVVTFTFHYQLMHLLIKTLSQFTFKTTHVKNICDAYLKLI